MAQIWIIPPVRYRYYTCAYCGNRRIETRRGQLVCRRCREQVLFATDLSGWSELEVTPAEEPEQPRRSVRDGIQRGTIHMRQREPAEADAQYHGLWDWTSTGAFDDFCDSLAG